MANIWLHRYCVILAVCTLFLVVAGAAVTSNDAGLSVPDWPLSYGQVMPPMVGGVFYEHGHRMVASTVGFLTVVMAIWMWRVERRAFMKRLGLAAVGLVIVQGVFGGLTVIFMLPKGVSSVHATLAEIFFSLTVAIAALTSPGWQTAPAQAPDTGVPSLRALTLFAPFTILVQVVLGALFRHRAVNIIPHVAGAMLVCGVVLYAAISVITEHKNNPALRKASYTLISITMFQVFLGIATYLSRLATADSVRPEAVMLVFTIAHVAVGASTLAASVLLALQVRRHVAPAAELALENA